MCDPQIKPLIGIVKRFVVPPRALSSRQWNSWLLIKCLLIYLLVLELKFARRLNCFFVCFAKFKLCIWFHRRSLSAYQDSWFKSLFVRKVDPRKDAHSHLLAKKEDNNLYKIQCMCDPCVVILYFIVTFIFLCKYIHCLCCSCLFILFIFCSSQCQARVPWWLQWTLVNYCFKGHINYVQLKHHYVFKFFCLPFSEDVLPSIHADPEYPCELVGTWNTWYGEQDQAGKSSVHLTVRWTCICLPIHSCIIDITP